ncbi:SusC/RagA family TonB-linked outer membrane protein [Chitinophaga horti]|uniref:SusC/RagA family TonB-linked outer membrane protein n=1 Tax=Chitinophaga horti TaxID=2920382 RepID=A0ABY6J479_9BACT|nr:SusC/RagA family TonB-linked outer membrane protein [Chitinophaga horti]UYQ94485.1 SusC/RagA family TonB-linked outer membrane protein [Chitinophaga horti]
MKHFLLFITGLQLCAHSMASGATAPAHPDVNRAARINYVREDIVVRGRVVDENGDPLIGVSIHPKNSTQGVYSDKDGNYLMVMPANGGVLVFSYIGYLTREETIKETRRLNITLKQDPKALGEVVVTALGIKRDEKALGYAATVVKNEQITNAISGNWLDALSGKVAGLNLIRSNGGPTGSIKVILRGENNLTGENEALIVVDNVVINSGSMKRVAIAGESSYGTGSDNMPADYGSSLNDLNPEDIDNITVLKGPAAAALYGQRAANGALIITTKAGTKGKKGLGITVTSNGSLEEVNRWPDLQYQYGQGLNGDNYYSFGGSEDGASTSGTSSAYGPKFDGQKFYQYDPNTQLRGEERTPWVGHKSDGVNSYFERGNTFTNSVSVDGAGEKTSGRLSFTNVNNNWIMPNTGYGRNSLAFSANTRVNEKFQVSTKLNYTNKRSENLPGSGYGNQSVMYWYIFWQPSTSIDVLRNYWTKDADGRKIKYPFSSFPENPFAIANEFLNKMNRNNIVGNVTATYNFTKELSLMARGSVDLAGEQRSQQRPWDAGTKLPLGSIRQQNIFSSELSMDFLLRYNKQINKDFDFSATLGGSQLKNLYTKDELRADSLKVPGIYKLANAAGPLIAMPDKSRMAFNSLFFLITGGFKNMIYVDITAREDWASTLALPERKGNSAFFYPSVSSSFILSEIFQLPKPISYAKFRLAAASVGSGGQVPYYTSYFYTAPPTFPGGLTNPTLLTNAELEPLRTNSYEAGIEGKLWKNRAGFDVAVYTGSTNNQILSRRIDPASGWPSQVINAGKVRNIGVEVALNGTPVSTKDFKWNTSLVYSANRNRIVSMPDSSVVLRTGPVGGGQIVARVGGSMGDLYGYGYKRAPDGQVVYDPATGFAKLSEGVIHLGNTLPKGKLGWTNDFTYKQFRLNLLFDAQWGAVAHSLMHYKLAEQGKITSTLPGRYNGIVGNGVIEEADGKYRKNDVLATDIDYYYRSHFGVDNAEGSTFRTDFIKFREARFDYTFKPAMLRKIGIQRAQVGIYGRNLAVWSPWPMFDPEFGTISGTDIVQGFEIAQFPSTRTFGFNLTIGL